MSQYILVIDEGTTSTRAMLFTPSGSCYDSAQSELTQYYPQAGYVEHDAEEIWQKTLSCARDMIAKAGGGANIISIGITNQRETVVFWDKVTGEPLTKAIVWQDRRTSDICDALKHAGHEDMVHERTGLRLDPYFSASKIGWALEHWPELAEAGENLAVGTVESYLIFRLTGGLHISDASNASRTALMNIDSGGWDDELCNLFNIPKSILPKITDCAGNLGICKTEILGHAIPICGSAGDQQAATIGQSCLSSGQSKATFGTGAFILTNTGTESRRSKNRLLSTIAWQIDGKRHYALEGSIFVAGSLIQWLRDDVELINDAHDSEKIAGQLDDNGGVYIVPALSGLGAPHWKADAKAMICGLSFATGKDHIIRASLEAMAYQSYDLKAAFADDGAEWSELRVDGGMVNNSWMVQFLADILNVRINRPDFVETTALGAAMLAAVGAGLYDDLQSASVMIGDVTKFTCAMDDNRRDTLLAGWQQAVYYVVMD